MKKVLLLLIVTLIFLLFPNAVLAENKAGINIGDHFGDFDKAAAIVGSGGWIVIMACPGDGDKIAQLAQSHPEINIVIRGHYPGQYPPEENNLLAKLWGATLASISFPKKVYFMPWNEPNHENEGGGATAGEEVYRYGQFLKTHFQDLGILDSKVILLSPMVDKLNPSFVNDSFFTNTGGKSAFYNLFSGSSINEYDQFSPGPCSAQPPANNCKYDEIGIPPPYYALETGVAGTCTPPCYNDDELRQMLDRSWLKWKDDGNFKMFAIFSYDPHRTDWDIFSNGTKTVEFLKSVASSGGGCCTQNSSSTGKSSNLNLCPGTQHSFYIESEIECTECGSGSSDLPTCIYVEGDGHENELSKNKINLNELARYRPEESDCLEVSLSGDINIDNLEIPLVEDLVGYLLGGSEDLSNPKSYSTFETAGPFRLLTTKYAQNLLKIKFIEEVLQRGEQSRYQKLKIQGLNLEQIKERFLAIDQKIISERTGADKSFLSNVWIKIPLFANEESLGAVIFSRTDTENNVSEVSHVDTSVPQVYRADKVTTYLAKMLVPGYKLNLQAKVENLQVLAEEDTGSGNFCLLTDINLKEQNKETIPGSGDKICTDIGENKFNETRSFANDAPDIVCVPLETDCRGAEAKSGDTCCNGNGVCKQGIKGNFFCSPNDPIKENNFGENDKINIINRVPFLAKIERNTYGSNGFFRIFIPAKRENPSSKEVAGESPNVQIAINNPKTSFIDKVFSFFEFKPDPLPSQGVLFYNLGTFKNVKEFVANKLLRPAGAIISTSPEDSPIEETPETSVGYIVDFRNGDYRISEETKNSVIYGDSEYRGVLRSWPNSKIALNWDFVYNQSITNGWNPAFVIALWIEESGANGVAGAYGVGCIRGDPENIQTQLDCLFSRPYANTSFDNFMCMYAEGLSSPCIFSLNPNFTKNVKYWYDRLTS